MFCHFVTNFSMDSLKTPFSHLYLFLPKHVDRDRKNSVTQWMTEFWQREKDSNPHKQSQSLSCYPYTIPLNFVFCDPQLTSAGLIIAKKRKLSRGFLKFFEKFFQVAVLPDSGVWAGLA